MSNRLETINIVLFFFKLNLLKVILVLNLYLSNKLNINSSYFFKKNLRLLKSIMAKIQKQDCLF
jgi:hypothetical protein